ncbi:MAG: sulfate ABC transporter permease subunit CysT, partial [Kovacikia sp.]
MAPSSFPSQESPQNTPLWKAFLHPIIHAPWTWRIMFGYLTVMLFMPVLAMLLKATTVGPGEFWRIATSPVALSTYDVTFTTSLIAALID